LAKSFIKDDNHAQSYENLEIKYISGRNPDLVIFNDNGMLLERIDLTQYSSIEDMHALMIDKGNLLIMCIVQQVYEQC
jgi:hypothetical protein